jgi:hypothetical protein
LIGDSSLWPTGSFASRAQPFTCSWIRPVNIFRLACGGEPPPHCTTCRSRWWWADGSRQTYPTSARKSYPTAIPPWDIIKSYVGNFCTVSCRVSHTCQAQQLEWSIGLLHEVLRDKVLISEEHLFDKIAAQSNMCRTIPNFQKMYCVSWTEEKRSKQEEAWQLLPWVLIACMHVAISHEIHQLFPRVKLM